MKLWLAKMKHNVLAVGAHPDDIELGCGGALLKHLENGDEVFVVVMTNGEMGGDKKIRRDECLESFKILGIKGTNITFGNFPDGELKDDRHTVHFLERIIRGKNISKVYTHSPEDRHQDHRNCSLAVSSAARKIPEILLFEGPSTKVNFEPHYFVEISEEQLGVKLDSLMRYKSQVSKGIVNIEWARSLAKANYSRTFIQNSEAFALNHVLKKGKDV